MLLIPLLLASLPQDSSVPDHLVFRIPEEMALPVIDGVLDEPLWEACPPIDDLRQTVPVAGADPSEHTEVLIAYDETDLYVGLRCFDSEPSGIRATQMTRDANLDPDDRVELLFDPFNDRRNGFWFQIGPAGSKGDALISKNGAGFNKQWDTIWYGRATVTDSGWFAEIRIPFASINFDPKSDTWGFNVRRHIRRRSEEVRWASPEPRILFFSIANGGKLHGFHGMKQGVGLDFVPFVVGSVENDDTTGERWEADAGLDIFYRISPSTKLSLSFNTDFAETEVDSRRVNLTRFPLFFPEKRKFFLEDSGVFGFGPGGYRGGGDVIPFFSRRIGLDGEGNEVPLLANAKLTSTTDGYSYGVLDSFTDDTATLDSRNLFAGRFSKNIFEQSDAGVIFTHGNPTGDENDNTAGADFNYRIDDFLGDRNLQFTSYLLKTESAESSGKDLAYHGGVSYPNDEVSASASYLVVEDNFDPALGFVRRTGVKQYSGSASYNPRLYSDVRRLRFQASPQWITDSSDRTETARVVTIPLGIDWESGEELRFFTTPQREVLFEEFEIFEGVVIPPGDYDTLRYGFNFETSNKRPLSWELDISAGEFYSGQRIDYGVELNWRASVNALFGVDYGLNDVDLDEGDFTVNVTRVRADFPINPRATWSNFVQWDDVSDGLGLNSRLRIIFEPGRELFLVLNQGWNTHGESFVSEGTDLRIKLAYNVRF
jgi:hypothetical protein